MTFRIPRRLESPNTWNGRHWRVKHRLTQQWEQAVATQELMHRGRRETTQDAARRLLGGCLAEKKRVTVERHVPSKRNFIRDDDNLRFAVKPLLDALKRRGHIHDDAREWLEHAAPSQHVSADGLDWTIVTIERM